MSEASTGTVKRVSGLRKGKIMKLDSKLLVAAMALTGVLATAVQAIQVAGTGVGAIPDRGTTGCGEPAGPQLTISFDVVGLASSVSNVGVQLTGVHTWVGDLTATLNAPGGSPSFVIFGATSATSATACGDSSDFGGPYNFNDGFANNWWSAALAAGTTVPIPAGNYSASAPGGAAGASGNATSFNAVFGGMTAAAANGTWALTVTDRGGGDTGSITAATLFINETAPVSLQSFSVD